MNKLAKVLILAALLSAVLPITRAQIENALSIADLSVTPNPAIAGENITITFKLYNSYDNSLKNIDMQLEGAYPLLNYSPYGTYLISTMGEGLYYGTYSYTIHIPSTTPEGTYTLDVVATYESTPTTSSFGEEIGSSVMPINIYVYNRPNITINLLPTQIVPGEPFQASIQVANKGLGTARNVVVRLESTPMIKVEGTDVFNIGTLPMGQAVEENAEYYASKELNEGNATLSFEISYTTDTNQTVNQTASIHMQVLVNKPELAITAQAAMPQTLYTGYNQSIQLIVDNIGSGMAKNISLSILPTNSTEVLTSTNSLFIGALAPGQSQEIPVLVFTNSSKAGIKVNAVYYSANYANEYSLQKTINLSVAPSAQFEIESEYSKLEPGASAVPITYVVKNTGNEEATNIQFSLESTYPITPVASTYYLQSLMPGQEANITFIVSADTNAVPGNYPVIIYEEWKQLNGAANQEYAGSSNYYATVSTQSSNGQEAAAAIALIVVLAAIGVAIGRRGRKRKG